jgi:hypothetical protein
LKLTSCIAGLAAALAIASPVWALPIHTAAGSGWEVAFANGASAPVFAETPIPGTWILLPGAVWVGATVNDGSTFLGGLAAPGVYVYTLKIGALFQSGGSFSLQYAADNTVAWSVSNGSLAGQTSCQQLDCFSTARSLSGNFSANSVLTATVVNGDFGLNPTGLTVAGNAFAMPEPSSYALMAIGGGLLAFRKRRR